MSENGERDEKEGGPAGMLLMIGILDVLLLGIGAYALSLGEPLAGAGIVGLALLLTGVDLWLYRRGSF